MADPPDVLLSLLNALERAHRKALPLLADPGLLDQEAGQDALDVICMPFRLFLKAETLETGLRRPWRQPLSRRGCSLIA